MKCLQVILGSLNYCTKIPGHAGNNYAVMQYDGNLVLFDGNDNPYWTSGLAAHYDGYVYMQGNGNLAYMTSTGSLVSNTGKFIPFC